MTQLAFIILAHTDPVHLNRMIKSLPENSEFFVHVDSKANITKFQELIDSENVHFTEQRVNVMWGSISIVDSQMHMIHDVLSSSNHFDYIISLSGLDYPIWDNDNIIKYFEVNMGKEILYASPMEKQEDKSILYRQHRPFNYKYYKYGSIKSKLRVALRKIIYTIGIRKSLHFKANHKMYELYKGSTWWAITPKLAKCAYDTWRNNHEYYKYFHDSFAPDETFIQTLAFNSAFAPNCLKLKKKFINLADVTPLTYIDYNDEVKVFTIEDYDELTNSGKMFFRKAVTGVSDSLLDKIDKVRNSTK